MILKRPFEKKTKTFFTPFFKLKKYDNSFVHIFRWSLYYKSPLNIFIFPHVNFQNLKMSERTIPRGIYYLGINFPTSSQRSRQM